MVGTIMICLSEDSLCLKRNKRTILEKKEKKKTKTREWGDAIEIVFKENVQHFTGYIFIFF